MDYQKYIELGFIRTESLDSVELERTGYSGFCLEKKVSDKILVLASSGQLDKPNMYIEKKNEEDSYHIIPISCEAVVDLFEKSK
jgi:hypothetical protein